MVEIPDSLHCIFNATPREREGNYVIEVPRSEVEHDAVTPGETYRVALVESSTTQGTSSNGDEQETESGRRQSRPSASRSTQRPPVDEGEVRDVTIESVGDQGDGIAKVERGFVVIVPDARPGDQPTVEIEEVKENVAFAQVVGDENPPAL